jgi:lipoprotein-releasing system permease protein
MNFTIKLALKHILSSKIQSLLVISAVALGVLVIIFIPAINDGFYNELLDKTINTSPHLNIERYEDTGEITTLKVIDDKWFLNKDKTTLKDRRIQSYPSVIKNIKDIEGIMGASPIVVNSGTLINGEKKLNVQYNGVLYPEHQDVVDINKDLVIGSYKKLNPDGIAISRKIAEKLRLEYNDTVVLATSDSSKTLKVVALYDSGFVSKDNSTVYVALSTAQNLSNIGHQVDSVGVKIKDPWHIESIATQITYATGFEVKTWKDDNESLLSEIQSFTYVMFLINLTIMMAVAAGVLGIMIILINSKYKQIGMLKALGVTSKGVMKIFVLEGFLLSFFGALVGSILATLLIHYYNSNPIPISENYGVTDLKGVYKLSIYLQGIILAFFSGCFAAFIPSYFASKIDPAEVLKST